MSLLIEENSFLVLIIYLSICFLGPAFFFPMLPDTISNLLTYCIKCAFSGLTMYNSFLAFNSMGLIGFNILHYKLSLVM